MDRSEENIIPGEEDNSNVTVGDLNEEDRFGRSEYICEAALLLFDRTQPLHELDERSRQITAQAGLLYDQALRLPNKKPLKPVRNLVKSQFGNEIPAEIAEELALVVALYTGRIKPKKILRMDLPTLQQRAIVTVSAMLMIAAGLDNSESQSSTIEDIQETWEGIWIVVNGPQALLDVNAANQAARLWEKIGYPPINVLESTEAEKIRETKRVMEESLRLTPDDPLSEAGRKVMHLHFQSMVNNEAGTRQGVDIEALHDMRVATRRLRAAFEVFGEAFEPKVLKKHLKGLRATGRALGRVRDLDVFMEKAGKYLNGLPQEQKSGLDPLLANWESQRVAARDEMLVFLNSKEYQVFKKDFNKFVHTPEAGALVAPKGIPEPHRVRELAPALIYDRLAIVRAFNDVVGSAPIETLHALRIEFKKLRYTVEYFQDVLGSQAKGIINVLKGMQDHLGDMNDADVAIQILKEFIKQEKKKSTQDEQSLVSEIQAIEDYLQYRRDERQHLMETFPAAWKNFNRSEMMRDMALAVSVL